ncbi:MAG TPA: hypothetical protein PLW93_01905 [Candidatus Absconditabacterales bacterium]|nr:hypothetical protein [Candidatus Absconditabacterales bacterium]HNG97004.1 hypothetical protein [Candidatus Absconditabacterales bacterium]
MSEINLIGNQVVVYEFRDILGDYYVGISNVSMKLFNATGRFIVLPNDQLGTILSDPLKEISGHFTHQIEKLLNSSECIYLS